MTTTSQAFAQFLTDITITEYQKTSVVEGRRSGVESDLGSAFPSTSDMPLLSVRLMGSAAKGTIVRPIDDIDVLAVFSNEKGVWQSRYARDSHAFIYRVRQAYSGFKVQQVGARGQAVRVFYNSGGHVDVAPVFMQNDSTYHLPSGTGGWILTSPFVANKWFSDKNAALDYNLAPLVRMLKKWNRAHSKRMRSFHMETVAGHVFGSLGSNRRTGLQKFFEWAPGYLEVSDPGGQSGSLAGYLGWTAKQDLLQALQSANTRAISALAAESRGDHDESKRLWRIILGDSFPV